MNSYKGFVYKWTNNITSKMYIGSHKGTIDDGYIGSGKKFNIAVDKYGIENFDREILEYIPNKEEILLREQYYLDKVNAAYNDEYYNKHPRAGGGFAHINNDPVLKAKYAKQAAIKMKAWIKENGHPKGMLDKNHTAKTKDVLSKKSKIWTMENIAVPVYQFAYDGTFIKKHDSITEAAKSVNGSPSNIKYTCEGKFRNAYRYQWSYENVSPGVISTKYTRGKKQVKTPAGIFNTITEAVKHHGFSGTNQVRRRCLSNKHADWRYIE